ncbi:MAG: biotin synthase auxiliary protein BsaP [Acidimicrobiales bacterium]
MRFCSGCGRRHDRCAGCAPELDPPRYCSQCGRWMAVVVTPAGWTARCRSHGEIRAPRPCPAPGTDQPTPMNS